jgi:hypothetical protein
MIELPEHYFNLFNFLGTGAVDSGDNEHCTLALACVNC